MPGYNEHRLTYGQLVDRLVERLISIQQQHQHWFQARPGEIQNQSHDTIANHIIIACNYPKIEFGFWPKSELPLHIREECEACFNEMFGTNKVGLKTCR